MALSLQITFHGLAHSDSVQEYVRRRATKLQTWAPRATHCRVALEVPHRHASRRHFRVRIDVTLPRGEVVVTRSPDAARPYEDLYATVDSAFDEIGRRLQDFVRRRRGNEKAHPHAHPRAHETGRQG